MYNRINLWPKTIIACFFAFSFFACKKDSPTPPKAGSNKPDLATVKTWLADKNATDETAALFYNLKQLAKNNILFGHQDATKRGLNADGSEWANEQHRPSVSTEKSDVKEVTGQYPAVYGHDFLHIANFETGVWFDYEKAIAKKLTIEAYNRGGVNTYSWHYANPVSKGSFYWADSPQEAVKEILPGGTAHETYKNSLKIIAEYAKSLIGADGKLVPIIFRPYHEMDGSWFWWGAGHSTAEDYKNLYRFTVNYLRDELKVHNFLYGWSPDRNFNSLASYLAFYPGDEYVDLVGSDNYEDLKANVSPTVAANKLKIVADYAISKNKLAALTETGLQNLSKADWYTQNLLKALQSNPLQLSYVLIWANTAGAYWTPYKGHPAEADFIKFKDSPYVMFGSETPNLYKF
ncbi:glycoside hydrolase family 26 protein [Pelobium manganitolerans]|uniref:glycoside hydrolase family 26 protein n=1 Tax=Pelobium manganitolerans TaxID=1842495 RepID=UPI000E7165D2|nr:glycosyl hydrolase [Pelobium manganitolerans]